MKVEKYMHKPTIYIFGARKTFIQSLSEKYKIIGFIDNDETKWETTFEGYKIYSPDILLKSSYDKVIIGSVLAIKSMTNQLIQMGLDITKIDDETVHYSNKARLTFLEDLSKFYKDKNIYGCVAEGGVFQGEFSKEINRLFPKSKFYLFDTFEGFDNRDIELENEKGYSASHSGYLDNTTENIVLDKLLHPELCIIKKGYFPDSVIDIPEEHYCFVNLDFDLYQPTLAGIEYFSKRMVSGGIILLHDYFHEDYKGIKQAVIDYENKYGKLSSMPIGDTLSLALLF